jgi:hypothetical protein
MAINGRINVDVLFHDTDGTTSLKVVSLEDSTEYTTGKVAIVTGTVGTAAVVVQTQPTTYKNAAGEFVSFSNVSRIAFAATGKRLNCSDVNDTFIDSVDGYVATTLVSLPGGDTLAVSPDVTAGTGSYTLVMYGT